ncbi:DNA/RNA non-specific endonuclease [Sphingomonas abietis]|uniref:Uncharacterized protein n=1 Tax=Sphingomonas abietis TaxID=3012344 RepID=A0ABY7NT46_9SPHN|nr:hypothetical protein [Sphingomonas abietis]WBO23818.1 hypothetical protein PBT88_06770 [Sphingomonas abietis]
MPVLAISESDRSQPQLSARINGLFRWPDLRGQPDERRLAAQGVMLARLVPQRKLAWGPQMAAGARAANLLAAMIPLGGSDSDFVHLGAWSALGAWLRVNHNPQATRVVYLSGAVPADGPPDDATPPRALWKIAVSVDASGRVVADAGLLPGAMLPDGLPGRTSIAAIAKASGLDFSGLQQALQNSGATTPQAATPAQLVARVYIEIRNVDTGTTQSIRDALSAQGFITPRIEPVDPCIAPAQLRYYYPQDLSAAQLAARTSTAAVQAAGLGGRAGQDAGSGCSPHRVVGDRRGVLRTDDSPAVSRNGGSSEWTAPMDGDSGLGRLVPALADRARRTDHADQHARRPQFCRPAPRPALGNHRAVFLSGMRFWPLALDERADPAVRVEAAPSWRGKRLGGDGRGDIRPAVRLAVRRRSVKRVCGSGWSSGRLPA